MKWMYFNLKWCMIESGPLKWTDEIMEDDGVHVGSEVGGPPSKEEVFLPDCIRRGPP